MKKLFKPSLYIIYLVGSVVLLMELILRVVFAFHISPRIIAYGTGFYENTIGAGFQQKLEQQYEEELREWYNLVDRSNTVYFQDYNMGGYRKFFPYEKKFHHDPVSKELFPITINRDGFRGKDFQRDKNPGTIRILTLGASSTFGFFNRDNETYPYQLEQELNNRCGSIQFEVLNFAIPKSTAENIRMIFMMEGLALQPDIVTFYEGRNDSDRLDPLNFRGGGDGGEQGKYTIWSQLKTKLLVLHYIDELFSNRAELAAEQARQTMGVIASQISEKFLADLEDIRILALDNKIRLIVANQQASSQSWFQVSVADREKMQGVTYTEEARSIQKRIEAGLTISGYEFNFLIHQRLMTDLEKWAENNKISFVNIIEELDYKRNHLVSYVHLDAYANSVIASAFADEILENYQCPDNDFIAENRRQ